MTNCDTKLFPDFKDRNLLAEQLCISKVEKPVFLAKTDCPFLRIDFSLQNCFHHYQDYLNEAKTSTEFLNKFQQLTKEQQAIHFINNNLFGQNYDAVQYFFDGNIIYAKAVKNAFKLLKLTSVYKIYLQNEKIYFKHKIKFDNAQLVDKLHIREISFKPYFILHEKVNKKIENYLQKNVSNFFLDLEGKQFKNKEKDKYISPKIDDVEYYTIEYTNFGKNEVEEYFFGNGILANRTTRVKINGKIKRDFEIFYENGQPKEHYSSIDYKLIGDHYFYYENGQIWKQLLPDYRLNYPPNYYNFWKEDGSQTLIEGNGFVYEYNCHSEYKNGLLHGKTIDYFWNSTNIKVETPYLNGKRNGIATEYYQNGNLKSEYCFIEDDVDWSIEYPELSTLEGNWKFTIGASSI